jgi:hypothetical protein
MRRTVGERPICLSGNVLRMIVGVIMLSTRIVLVCTAFLGLALMAGCSQDQPMAPNGASDGLARIGGEKAAGGVNSALVLGNNTVPFRVEVHNTIEVVPPEPDDPETLLRAIFEGYGKMKPFGPFVLYSTSVIDMGDDPNTQETEMVFTFRNGDILNISSWGTAFTDANGDAVFSGELAIMGGTGRFSNATGSGTYAGTASLYEAIGQYDAEGHISGFGGHGD